jgi:hypothetical protein
MRKGSFAMVLLPKLVETGRYYREFSEISGYFEPSDAVSAAEYPFRALYLVLKRVCVTLPESSDDCRRARIILLENNFNKVINYLASEEEQFSFLYGCNM